MWEESFDGALVMLGETETDAIDLTATANHLGLTEEIVHRVPPEPCQVVIWHLRENTACGIFPQVAKTDPHRLSDGYLSMEGGVDGEFSPSLLQANEVAWMVNATCRGGYLSARPSIHKRTLDFQSDAAVQTGLEDAYFQGAGTYLSDDGVAYLMLSVGGRLFRVNCSDGFKADEITISGDPNMATQPHAWFQQAENWLIVQNGLDRPMLYNGSGTRRADQTGEVPTGGPMAYGKGRLWVARGSLYFGGDLVGSNPSLGRGSVIKFTENEYLSEGGAFSAPGGDITGMAFAANLDTSLGDGDLLVFTNRAAFAFNAPIDRTVWKNLNYPIQRYALMNYGAVNHETIQQVNGDLFFRAQDGVRSLAYARRDFSQWGNTPISRQVHRALNYDTKSRLYAASAVNFDNRFLMTTQPQIDYTHGVYHRGLVVLDFNNVAGMGRKLVPAWEGVWTGLRVLQIVTLDVSNVTRCFIVALDENDKVTVWELTTSMEFDFDGTNRVETEWIVETKGFTFGLPKEKKRLQGADGWMDDLSGNVSATLRFRTDDSACWIPWSKWSDCAKVRDCTETEVCDTDPAQQQVAITNYRHQKRSRISFSEPPDVVDSEDESMSRDGFEFQLRFENTGRFRMKRLDVVAERQPENIQGDMRNTTCLTATSDECQSACREKECCDPDDYGYDIEAS